MNNDLEDVCVFDIETNASTDPETAICRVWGLYSFKTDKFYYGYEDDGNKLQELINQHRFVVGHNIQNFDFPIIERQYGIEKHPALHLIDTLLILAEKEKKNQKAVHKGAKERVAIIGELRIVGLEDNRLPGVSLEVTAKHFAKVFKGTKYEKYFGDFKDDLDYDVLIPHSSEWNFATKAKILSYLKQDLIVTKNLYLFFEDYFSDFQEWLSPEDIYRKLYINSTPGIMGYSALCHLAGLKTEFNKMDDMDKNKINFEGAYVMLPLEKEGHGDGYCCDFASLYPHMFMLFNLFTPEHKCPNCKDGKCPNRYVPRGLFKSLQGVYCGCKLGLFESIIQEIYMQRTEYKKAGDPKQYRNKIMINLIYGLSGSPIFKHLYNLTTASDCTRAGRIMTKYMIERFIGEGYDVRYADTDSAYLFDPYNDPERLKVLMNKIEEELLADVNIPQKTFGIDIDDDFQDIFFFEDEGNAGRFKKKNYFYIRKDGSTMIHGLAVIKRGTPLVAKKIFIEHLLPKISESHTIYFDKKYIEELIHNELKNDISLLGTLKIAKPLKSYKTKSSTGYMVCERYGTGRHYLIPNNVGLGIGKSKFYCTLEEAKGLNIRDLDLTTTWSALKPFIKVPKQMRL